MVHAVDKGNGASINSVQWLRGLAAVMVVAHHARKPFPWLSSPLSDYHAFASGVDIFFVISGFIMFVAARSEPPLEFLRKRFVRVVPMYWIWTLLLLVLTMKGRIFSIAPEEADHVVRSLLFVPHYSIVAPDQVWPYLIPGWTLNYEVFFYAVFFAALIVGRPLLFTTATIGLLVSWGVLSKFEHDAVLLTYTNPQMLEFVAGLLIGWLYVRYHFPGWLLVLLPVGMAGLLVPEIASLSVGVNILSSAMILLGAIAANAFLPDVPWLRKIGDASYSIYLSHTVIGLSLAKKFLPMLPGPGFSSFWLWLVGAVFCSTAVGYAMHRFMEKPLLAWMKPKPNAALPVA